MSEHRLPAITTIFTTERQDIDGVDEGSVFSQMLSFDDELHWRALEAAVPGISLLKTFTFEAGEAGFTPASVVPSVIHAAEQWVEGHTRTNYSLREAIVGVCASIQARALRAVEQLDTGYEVRNNAVVALRTSRMLYNRSQWPENLHQEQAADELKAISHGD